MAAEFFHGHGAQAAAEGADGRAQWADDEGLSHEGRFVQGADGRSGDGRVALLGECLALESRAMLGVGDVQHAAPARRQRQAAQIGDAVFGDEDAGIATRRADRP